MPQLVSAIIPTCNRAHLLLRALASVVNQDYRPIEAVVVDDGSTDHTPSTVEELRPLLAARGVDLTYHRQPRGGAPRARNAAMQLARGTLYAFLDSDDLWLRDFVPTLVGLLDRYPEAGLAFSGILVIDADDGVLRERDSQLPPGPTDGPLVRPFELLLRFMPLQTSGVMVRRSAVAQLGGFATDLAVGEDWDLWYRIAKEFDFAYTRKALACNREHPGNLPKWSAAALASNIQINIRHLADVQDPLVRGLVITRIRRQVTLMQEQLLREGRPPGDLPVPVPGELAPRSARYRLGQMVGRGPQWLGRCYAGVVRWIGQHQRERSPDLAPWIEHPAERGSARELAGPWSLWARPHRLRKEHS